MTEKELMIEAMREKSKNIDNKNIEDYKGFIKMLLSFLYSQEQDEALWKELANIGAKLLSNESKEDNFRIPFQINDNLNIEYYNKNGYSFDELKYKVEHFEDLSPEVKSIVSFRVVNPEILEPNYRPFQ